jgi:hypothetical protein
MIVRVELLGLEPTATDDGETPQVAKGVGPVTAQLKFTGPEKPFCPVNVKPSVICIPVCVVIVVEAGAKVKSCGWLKVAVTVWLEFMVMLQTFGSLPTQAPLHPVKTEVPTGVARSDTVVPCG